MTVDQFATECASRLILPSIALEDDEIVDALRSGDDELVIELLESNF